MPKAETDLETPDLPGELDTLDEIHLPGDEEKRKAEEAAAPPEPTPQVEKEEAAEASSVETQEEEEETPRSTVEQFTDLLSQAAGGAESGEAAPARDLAAELEEARRRERELLEARIEDLKAQRQEPQREEAQPDLEQARQERIRAAEKALTDYLSREDLTVEEQAAGIVAVQKELLDMEREDWTSRELGPIRERIKKADEERQATAYRQQAANEVQAGLQALVQRGGATRDLAADFAQNGVNSYLGQALVANWDQKTQALPPNMQSRQVVEALGVALAAEMEKALASGGLEVPATQTSPSGIVPKKRKPSKEPKGDEALAEQLFEETTAHMSDAMARLGLDKVEFRPQNR